MTPGEKINQVSANAQLPDFHENYERYIADRKTLIDIAVDETVPMTLREDAATMQAHLKLAFYGRVGALGDKGAPFVDVRENLNVEEIDRLVEAAKKSMLKYPDAPKTSKDLVKLSEKFEFKAQPLALGVKHYYAKGNQS